MNEFDRLAGASSAPQSASARSHGDDDDAMVVGNNGDGDVAPNVAVTKVNGSGRGIVVVDVARATRRNCRQSWGESSRIADTAPA